MVAVVWVLGFWLVLVVACTQYGFWLMLVVYCTQRVLAYVVLKVCSGVGRGRGGGRCRDHGEIEAIFVGGQVQVVAG